MATRKTTPSWSSIKTELANVDRAGLLALVQDLYAASKGNQAFLHARLGLGDDPLKPYKAAIEQWINPSDFRKPTSVAKAKKAIGDYKKALGRPEGLAELMVHYCEHALGPLLEYGMDDESFCVALMRMFDKALNGVLALPAVPQAPLLARLDQVRQRGREVGWGVGDGFDDVWLEAGLPR